MARGGDNTYLLNFFSGDERAQLEQLVARCRKGDSRAWDQVIERFKRLVYSIARRSGLSEDDAGDVFQSTFVALYRHLDRIESAATLPKWISTTASRESIRISRQNARTQPHDATLEEVVASEDEAVDAIAIDAVQAEDWRNAIQKLGGRCAQLLGALYFDDKTYDVIVAELGIPMGAIGPTRARCLDKLRKVYQAQHKETLYHHEA